MLALASVLAVAIPTFVLAMTQAGRGLEAPDVDHVAISRELVEDLAAKRFDMVEQHFNESVAQVLPAEMLRATWGKMISDLGEFVSIKWAGHEQKQDLDYVYVTCSFSRKNIDLLFVFDALQKVAGFKTLPASSFGLWQTPSYANPESFVEVDVKIGQRPWILPGTLAMPKGAGPFPAVVLVHGWGANDEDETAGPDRIFKDIAWGLASRGVAVLRYVKRTKQYGSEVAKNLASFTVEQETIEDARSAVTLLSGMHRIDSHHIFLLGEGLGGYLGPRIAAPDSQIAGLILMGAYARPLEDVFLDQVRFRIGSTPAPTVAELEALAAAQQEKRQIEDPALSPGMTVRLAGAHVPAAYLLDLRDYSPTRVAATLKIPILILQGEREAQSPSADWEHWRTSLRDRTNITFKSYPALNQSFLPVAQKPSATESRHIPENVIADLSLWIQRHSGAAGRLAR
jgi:hypothetical protein